ncbi:MAG: putative Ribokinase [Parcubacteria group bacterium Gr01-1014_38]|nr:MAG: putative Ribokinase [Parcubacteria group bacterium Gr01-1014_38]
MQKRRVPYDLVSIGDATVDVFLKLHDATVHCTLNRRACLLCFRYADKIPVEAVTRVPAAGNAANNAVGSARLGLSVAMVTTLGSDEAGRGIAAELRKNGVAMPYVIFDRRRGTNYSTVLSFQGERTILIYHEPRTYRLPVLAPSFRVYLTSMGKGWERIVPPLLRYLQTSGASLAFNPGTHQLRGKPSALLSLLKRTDVLLVNREEAATILKRSPSVTPRTLLSGLHALGPATVVITDGPAGSYALRDGDAWSMPPYPLPAVERTGAGDAYSTGFLAALSYGTDIADALRWGAANAGSVIQKIGPQAGLLTRSGIQGLLRRYPRLVPKPLP